ncbi:hypothetical protein ACNR9Q_02730 [Maribacter sp. X9]|uniref:hypothetical protein n=1 Tax=Maribacter sp. X9 TaxID=3402159 RepID=UPI003AF3B60D
MKKVLPIFFTVLYLVAMVKPIMPIVEFVINKDYIVEFLCINKDKPMLNCDGKCYLAKMIQKEQKDRHQNLPSADLRDYPIGFVQIFDFDFSTVEPSKHVILSFQHLTTRQFLPRIFHPPNC